MATAKGAGTYGKFAVGVVFFVAHWVPHIQTNMIRPLEAAFQGRCEDPSNPCSQLCFNIHHDMYECDCREGFTMGPDGYNCLKVNSTEFEVEGVRSLPSIEKRENRQISQTEPSTYQSNVQSHPRQQPPLVIDIEVDILPPPEATNSKESIENSMPELAGDTSSTHLHWSAVVPKKGPWSARPHLAAPLLFAGRENHDLKSSDIKVLFEDEAVDGSDLANSSGDGGALFDDEDSVTEGLAEGGSGIEDAENTTPSQRTDKSSVDYVTKEVDFEGIEEPRALPLEFREQPRHNGDLSDGMPRENQNTRTSECNLDCGKYGACVIEKSQTESCVCEYGKTGERCNHDFSPEVPRFRANSHLALPMLTDAYSDLQLSVDFKPESPDGIIMLTGETVDMTGDYLALLLRDGYAELVLELGTGPGTVRSSQRVLLNTWNRLNVFRHDWGVWIQLNNGRHDEGRSKGLFSRITFAQPVVLGSPDKHFTGTAAALGIGTSGMEGCLRNLEINNRMYSFKSSQHGQGGDALEGRNVEECDDKLSLEDIDDSCHDPNNMCENGGICITPYVESADQKAFCQCPLGFNGESCQSPVNVKVPSFDGTGYLMFDGLPTSPDEGITNDADIWNDIEIVLKPDPEVGNGERRLLFYIGPDDYTAADGNNDFLAVYLDNSKHVVFAFDAGDGMSAVTSRHPLNLDRWQSVKIYRTGLLAEIQVDDGYRVSKIGKGAFTQVSVSGRHLYIGGVPNGLTIDSKHFYQSFNGCIQKVSINGIELGLTGATALTGANVMPCIGHPCNSEKDAEDICGTHGMCKPKMEDYFCNCPLYFTGERCENTLAEGKEQGETNPKGISSSLVLPAFDGDGFLEFYDREMTQNLLGNSNNINIRVRLEKGSAPGLIFWTGGHSIASDFLMLGVTEQGHAQFRFNLGNGQTVLTDNQTAIDDGRWHRIVATRTEQTATLRVDNGHVVTGSSLGILRQLNTSGKLFVGGIESMDTLPIPQFQGRGMRGCVGQLSVGKLFNVEMVLKAVRGVNVNKCIGNYAGA